MRRLRTCRGRHRPNGGNQRLRPYRLADAEWAIENVSPVSGTISGPTDIVSEGTYHWQVTAAGAEGSSSFELRATVGSHGRMRWVIRTVSVLLGSG